MARHGRAILVILLFLGSSAASVGRTTAREPIPPAGEFRKHLLAVIASYPTNGSMGYWWPRGKGVRWGGTTRDLVYGKRLVARGDRKRRSYCSGLTFEVFYRAWKRWCASRDIPFSIAGMSYVQVKDLQRRWYGANGDKRCSQGAIVSKQIGALVPHARLRKGDFVQLWRRNRSGHSVVFIAWVRDGKGRRTGIRYWSTQPGTKGIGYRVEHFRGPRGVTQVLGARVGR